MAPLPAVQWPLPALAVPWLAGCAGPLSILDPAGPGARYAVQLWWPMFVVAALVLALVVGLWVAALARRPRAPGAEEARRAGRRWVISGGILLPTASILLLLGFGVPIGQRMLTLAGEAPLRIDVTARQWQWEVRYPESGIVLVNEIRLPAGRPVDIHLGSADVIHAFWVPRLGRKLDAVPGRIHVLRLTAGQAGSLRGQCSEFCGTGHAHMGFRVEVLEAAAFSAWLGELERRGGRGEGGGP